MHKGILGIQRNEHTNNIPTSNAWYKLTKPLLYTCVPLIGRHKLEYNIFVVIVPLRMLYHVFNILLCFS